MKPAEIVAFRKRHGLTQAQLAKLLGVDRVSIARWETAAHPIHVRTEMKLNELDAQLIAAKRFRQKQMHCPDCGQPMRRAESMKLWLCDTKTCATAPGGGAWRDPIPPVGHPRVRAIFLNSEGDPDIQRIEAVLNNRFHDGVGGMIGHIRIELVREPDGWRVVSASASWPPGADLESDHRPAVIHALREAGIRLSH